MFCGKGCYMNPNEIATKADIEEVIKAIERLQNYLTTSPAEQEFLRSADVKKMLRISDGTLRRLRISGALDAKKLNGTWFYKLSNIKKLMKNEN
jgi:hypothetical protein